MKKGQFIHAEKAILPALASVVSINEHMVAFMSVENVKCSNYFVITTISHELHPILG